MKVGICIRGGGRHLGIGKGGGCGVRCKGGVVGWGGAWGGVVRPVGGWGETLHGRGGGWLGVKGGIRINGGRRHLGIGKGGGSGVR